MIIIIIIIIFIYLHAQIIHIGHKYQTYMANT